MKLVWGILAAIGGVLISRVTFAFEPWSFFFGFVFIGTGLLFLSPLWSEVLRFCAEWEEFENMRRREGQNGADSTFYIRR